MKGVSHLALTKALTLNILQCEPCLPSNRAWYGGHVVWEVALHAAFTVGFVMKPATHRTRRRVEGGNRADIRTDSLTMGPQSWCSYALRSRSMTN